MAKGSTGYCPATMAGTANVVFEATVVVLRYHVAVSARRAKLG